MKLVAHNLFYDSEWVVGPSKIANFDFKPLPNGCWTALTGMYKQGPFLLTYSFLLLLHYN